MQAARPAHKLKVELERGPVVTIGFNRRGVMTGAGAALAMAGAARAQVQGDVAVMKFAMRGSQPVTTVFIGQHGPYIVLIDTGNAVACSLRKDICESIGLKPTGFARVYGSTGTDTQIGYEAHDVTFGQAVSEKDVMFLGLDWPKGGIDGILPLSVFTARPTDMDFQTGEMRLQLSGSVNRTGFRAVHAERVRQSNGAFVIDAVVEGSPARLLVDTGASTTVSLASTFVRTHDLWDKHAHAMEHQFGGVTAAIGKAKLVRTPELKVGPYRFKDVVISLTNPRMTTLSDVDGLIGIELLRRFTLGFDRPASTLWLKPNEHLADPYAYDHSGLTWEFKNGACVVVGVAPGSPAETAGLKVGDKLYELTTQGQGLAWDYTLSGEPETVIQAPVERDGKRLPLTMVLKDWL
ncbi:hypothetical protein BH09PSE2_BH09PSE2_01580 [soil metagenome]